MRTLNQIEARTPISSVPFTITSSGSYYLTTNLTVNSGNAITIATNNVTLDLGGFTIASTAPVATGAGIEIAFTVNLSDVTIFNGHILGGVTNNNGVFNGPGFIWGVISLTGANLLVREISVSGCQAAGILLSENGSTMVDSCVVQRVGNTGIRATIVKNSMATACGVNGIIGGQVSDSRGEAFSSGGIGISSFIANNCIGYRSGGTAIQATIASGCYAGVGTNLITYKYNMP